MRYIFIDMAWDEYLFWQKNDKQKINKINEPTKSINRLKKNLYRYEIDYIFDEIKQIFLGTACDILIRL